MENALRTEENARLRVVADMSDTTLTGALRIVNEFCDSRIKRAKSDTLRNMRTQVNNKAVFPDGTREHGYITLKAFDSVIDEMLR